MRRCVPPPICGATAQTLVGLPLSPRCHDVQCPTEHTLDPFYKLSPVASIRPYQLQPTITPPMRVLRFLDALVLVERFEQHFTSISILHRGRSHYHQLHQTKCIHNQMSLAPSHVLGGIVASLFATFCRLDRLAVQQLAVQHCCRWLLVASQFLPQRLAQSCVDALPGAIDTPQPEVVVDALPGREIVRQRSPLAAILRHVEDRVEYLAPRVKAWTSASRLFWAWTPLHLRFGHKWRNYLPLFIIQISRVDLSGLICTHSLSLPDCPPFA